jgi:hypothetical protein
LESKSTFTKAVPAPCYHHAIKRQPSECRWSETRSRIRRHSVLRVRISGTGDVGAKRRGGSFTHSLPDGNSLCRGDTAQFCCLDETGGTWRHEEPCARDGLLIRAGRPGIWRRLADVAQSPIYLWCGNCARRPDYFSSIRVPPLNTLCQQHDHDQALEQGPGPLRGQRPAIGARLMFLIVEAACSSKTQSVLLFPQETSHIDAPGFGEAQVEIQATGLCGSDREWGWAPRRDENQAVDQRPLNRSMRSGSSLLRPREEWCLCAEGTNDTRSRECRHRSG